MKMTLQEVSEKAEGSRPESVENEKRALPTSGNVKVEAKAANGLDSEEDQERAIADDGDDVEFTFPDGGIRAWLVVLGTALSSTASFGYVNSWGVFQSYYERTLLSDLSPSTIAWIGSVQYALVFLPALPIGRLFDLGYFKIPFLISSCAIVAGAFLTGECTKYWQFMLCQGILQGVACGCVYGPTMGVIGHWFKERRGRAMGLTAVGSSIGGTVFPIASRRLIDRVGFPWTMRILGFILLFCLMVPNITLARRLPPKNIKGGLFNFAAFKNPAFTVYTISGVFGFLGLYTVLTYIDIAALSVGVPEDLSFYLVAIANASSMFGRFTAGIVVDKIGPVNFIAPTTFLAGILTFAWPFAKSLSSLIAIAIIYGFMCGTYVSSFLICLFEMGEIQDVGRRSGMVMSVSAFGGLLGTPISGAINHATGGFVKVGAYAGSVVILSVIMMLITKYLMLGRLWGKF
ncbi:MFS general substrate transporter [Marasmius fiardii PR-910]|nr:MFS general substrate transporter [Marasmius fiardii PR-910]